MEELAEVLAIDFNDEGVPKLNPRWRWEDQEQALLSSCSSLITIVNAGESRVVQFSHSSVKEFLTSNRLGTWSRDSLSHYYIQLESARVALTERKAIERAKGILMTSRRLSEKDAFALLRQTAMKQNKRMFDIAEAILSMADVLKM